MPSLTVENYAKCIYLICTRQDEKSATTGQIAEALEVSPGTVTSMLKTLKDAGLGDYKPYEGMKLTDAGRALALRVVRRHRLIELFLAKTLDMSWDEVHAEAENMEHAVSDLLVDRIDKFLGFPAQDPHGDPIPKPDGEIIAPAGCRLADWNSSQSFQINRVVDQTPEFLRYLSELGLELGTTGQMVGRQPEAGILTFQTGGGNHALSIDAAEKVFVIAAE